MNDQKMVKAGSNEAQNFDPENFSVPGMENIGPGELRIPLLKLVQGTSKMGGADGHLGEWHNSVTGDFTANPELLMIGVAKGRVMFPREYSAENKPLCGSDDGLKPREDYIGQIIKAVSRDERGDPVVVSVSLPPVCVGCPFSEWVDNKPPRCSEIVTFAGMLAEGLPALIQFMKTGMKNAPNLKTLIAANGIRKAIRLGSVRESNDTGVYYVPIFTVGGKPDKEWQSTAMRLAQLGNLAARNQQAVIEYENRQTTEHYSEDEMGENSEPYFPDDLPF